MNNPDLVVHDLERLISYGQVNDSERQVLRGAIDLIRTPDDALDQAVPHLSTLAHLLEAVTDPKKAARTVQQLRALVDEANVARSAASIAIAELDTKRVEIEPKLAAAKEEHAAKLAEAQAAFDRRVAEFQRSLSVRQAEIADLEKAAKADVEAAAKLRAELSEKLAAVRAAAA